TSGLPRIVTPWIDCWLIFSWSRTASPRKRSGSTWMQPTIRLKLLKIGARLHLTARKVWLSFSEAYPYASDIAPILANLKQHPAWSPPG
ncbi:transposase, partial [Thiolapillus sp.]|uniref:transposase n=1 Tax=Thiolapillus sp. TaxID=2017437 RepID=UPI003AF4B00A